MSRRLNVNNRLIIAVLSNNRFFFSEYYNYMKSRIMEEEIFTEKFKIKIRNIGIKYRVSI